MFRIREKLPRRKQRSLALISIVTFLFVWWLITWPMLPPKPLDPTIAAATVADALMDTAAPTGELDNQAAAVKPDFEARPGKRPLIPAQILPAPQAVLMAIVYLHQEQALVRSAARSVYRITAAFLFASLVAIPLGLLMGTYPPIRNWIEPITGPLRYLPISAVIPLFIIWFGIGDTQKIAFLFTGVFVYLLPMVIEAVDNVDQIYLDTASTLGARQHQLILKVLLPGAWPGIFEACRVLYGVGWTYVILAEIVNAQYGLGHLLMSARRRGHIDWVYALIVVVLILGVAINYLFVIIGNRLFSWKEAKQ